MAANRLQPAVVWIPLLSLVPQPPALRGHFVVVVAAKQVVKGQYLLSALVEVAALQEVAVSAFQQVYSD